MSDFTKIGEIKKILGEQKAKKNFGQNFLTNPGVLQKMIEAAELDKNDTVVEIGPGLGTLTIALAAVAGKIIAVEKDKNLIPILQENLKHFTNVSLIEMDALNFNPPQKKYKIVANIPYNITSPLIDHFIRDQYMTQYNKYRCNIAIPSMLLLMVQYEVAKKITAMPPDMNVLALHVQTFANIKYLFKVSKGSFYPSPKVDSAVIKITPLLKPRVNCDLKIYFDAIHRAFSQKRKQLKRSLGIADTRRPQELSINDWDQYFKKS